MLRRILIGLDGSEAGAAAATLAGWVAHQLGSQLRLVSVVEEPPPYISAGSEERSARAAAAAYYADAHRKASARLQRRGLRADSRIEAGNEASGLLAAAAAFDADLIAIGHAGHSGVWGTGLGATAGRVAGSAPSSVLVAQRAAIDPARLLVAYDGSPDAIRAVELGAALAAPAGLGLTIAASPELVADRDPRRAVGALRERVAPNLAWNVATIEGDPVRAIDSLSSDGEHTLVLVGAHGARHPWAGGLGPVALGVLERAAASVIVVRPPTGSLTARGLMRARPVAVTPETSVGQAAAQLLRLGIKCLPVIDASGRPVGVLTLGDLLRRAAFGVRHSLAEGVGDEELEREISRLTESGSRCGDLMTRGAATASPDAPVSELLRVMSQRSIKRVLIVDDDGVLVGIVARSDILRALAGAGESTEDVTRRAVAGGRAGDIMRPGIAKVSTSASAEDVARAVLGSRVGRVAVVDPAGRLVGVIASRDLLSLATDETRQHLLGVMGGVSGRLEAFLAGLRHGSDSPPTAGDLMRRDVVTVAATAPLGEVLRVMMSRALKRILVLDRDGVVAGVVDRADVVRVLAEALNPDRGGPGSPT